MCCKGTPFGECTQAFLHLYLAKPACGGREVRDQVPASPFPKEKKKKHVPTLGANPATSQPRPRALRGWPGDPAASDGARLSQVRGATWWPRRALPAGLRLHVALETTEVAGRKSVWGSPATNRCVVTELRHGSRQTSRESASILKLPLCELEVTYLVNGDISTISWEARKD